MCNFRYLLKKPGRERVRKRKEVTLERSGWQDQITRKKGGPGGKYAKKRWNTPRPL